MDMPLARRIWHEVMPHLPLPADAGDTEIVMHMTRTQAESISFRARAYSHAWLHERCLPSCLPDELRPRAQRIYPIVASAVGVAVRNRTPAALAIRQAMIDAVKDEGLQDPVRTRRAMRAARAKARFLLLGIKE
jgi:hypothetical protein